MVPGAPLLEGVTPGEDLVPPAALLPRLFRDEIPTAYYCYKHILTFLHSGWLLHTNTEGEGYTSGTAGQKLDDRNATIISVGHS